MIHNCGEGRLLKLQGYDGQLLFWKWLVVAWNLIQFREISSSQWCRAVSGNTSKLATWLHFGAWITVTPFRFLSDLKDNTYLKSFNSCCSEGGTFSENVKQNGNKTIAYLPQISSLTSLLTELQFYPRNSKVTLSQAWELILISLSHLWSFHCLRQ